MSDYNKKIIEYGIVKSFRDEFQKYDYIINPAIIKMNSDKPVVLPTTGTIVKILNEFEIFAIAHYYLEIDEFFTWSMVNGTIYKFMGVSKIKKIIDDARKNEPDTWNHIVALRRDMLAYDGIKQAC